MKSTSLLLCMPGLLLAAASSELPLELEPLTVKTERTDAPAFAITVAAELLPETTAAELQGEAELPPLQAVGSLEDAAVPEPKAMPKILVTGSRLNRD